MNEVAESMNAPPSRHDAGLPPALTTYGVRDRQPGRRPGSDDPVLGLEDHVDTVGQVVWDQGRQPDAEVDEVAVAQLPGHSGAR